MNKVRNNILLLILMLCSPVAAQQEVVDSLLQVLQNHKKKDTVRVELLFSVVIAYNFNISDSAEFETVVQYAREGLALSEKLNHKTGIAFFYSVIGSRHHVSKRY